MTRFHIALAAAPLFLAACGNAEEAPTPPAATATVSAAPVADGALGLTEAQLLDADLIDAKGIELGEVERVIRGREGAIDGFLIEIEDSNPDRFVQLPLDGLTTVQQGDDWDLRADTTRESLMALPEAPRP